MPTLTVAETREMLKTPEGREKLNAAIHEATGRAKDFWCPCCDHFVGDFEEDGICPRCVGDVVEDSAPFLTTDEEQWPMIADPLAACMWRALPRETVAGQWRFSDMWTPSWTLAQVDGYFAGAEDISVVAPTYREALALALAACGRLKVEDRDD